MKLQNGDHPPQCKDIPIASGKTKLASMLLQVTESLRQTMLKDRYLIKDTFFMK
jgi:hypothetical protein